MRENEKAYPDRMSAVILVDPSAEKPGEDGKKDLSFNEQKFEEYKKGIPPLDELEKELKKIEVKKEPDSLKKMEILKFMDQVLLFREKTLAAMFHEEEYFHRGVAQANGHPSATISHKPFIIVTAEQGVLTKSHEKLVKA